MLFLPSPAVAKLELQVEAIFDLTARATRRFRFLRPMFANPKLIRRIESEEKGVGFTHVRNWLYWGLVLELSKICRDNGKRSPSIYAIRNRLATDTGLVQALEDKYARNNRLINEEAALRNEFRMIHDRFCKSADEMLNGRVAGGYRNVRNKLIAHNEQRGDGSFHDVRDEKLEYGDERALLETLQTLVTDLELFVRTIDTQSVWDQTLKWDEEMTRDFWELDSRAEKSP